MNTKLTLTIDKEILEKAKAYAAKKQVSLSQLIDAYLKSILDQNANSEIEISPFVRSMATGRSLPLHLDDKSEFFSHLSDKHK